MTDAPTNKFSWVKHVEAPAAKSWEQVKGAFNKDAEAAVRRSGFARVGTTGVGLAMVSDALLRSKSSGEDRSALVRMGEGVLGLGVAAAAVIAGHGR